MFILWLGGRGRHFCRLINTASAHGRRGPAQDGADYQIDKHISDDPEPNVTAEA